MKALTIQQPWAALIAAGEKRVENRTWPTKHRGQLAIHTAKKDAPNRDSLPSGYWQAGPDRIYQRGAIIAVAELVNCIDLQHIGTGALDPELPTHEIILDDPFITGPWCWVLQNIRTVHQPIPCRGQLGLWEIPASIEEQIAPCLII